MRKITILVGGCAAMAMASALVSPVQAQTGTDSAAQSDEGFQDGAIIVTARRREETAQESPVALTVLDDTLLERYGVDGVDSIATLTPGFHTGETSGSAGGSISLRGVGSGEGQAFIDQAVSINVDGVPISTAQILRAAQMDLQQIEVLRGPQALFFGKNSPGGIISLTTANPGDELELMLRGGYEFKADEFYIDATLSAPIGDTAGIRLAAHYSEMDGYIDVISPPTTGVIPSGLDAFPKKDELFLRGTVQFEPSDRFKMTLKATYTDTDIIGGPSYYSDIVFCPYGTPQEAIPVLSNCQNDGVIVAAQLPAATLALSPYITNPNGSRSNEQWLLTGTIDYELSDVLKLTSVTGFYDVDEAIGSNGGYGLVANNAFGVLYKNRQLSQELRLASDFGGGVDFLLGGFFEDRDLYTLTYIVVPVAGNFELPIESTNQNQKAYSLFGQVLLDLSDQVELTVGGRYSHEVKKLLDYTVTTAPFGTPVVQGTATDVTMLAAYPGTRLTFNNFSPEVTLTYKPHSDMMLFASFKQGFKSGGFDAGYTAGAILANPARGQTFAPEKVTGGEIGLKSQFADRQVTFNATAYWYDYSDLQVTAYDTSARAFTTQNAAKARVRGIELDTRYQPQSVPGLDLHASLAYNDAKFRNYIADCYKGQTVALGCDQVRDTVTGNFTGQDLAGVQLRKAPKFVANLGGYYEFPLASSWMMSLSTDVSYSTGYNYGTTYQPFTYQNDYAKIDASLRFFSDDDRWELALIGRNLTNKRNLVNGIDRTGTGGGKGTTLPSCTTISQTGCEKLPDVIGTPTQPRTVALQATFRY